MKRCHKNNGLIDVSFTGLAAPGTFNSETKTCDPYCHSPNNNDPKPDPTWGTTLGACGTSCHTKPPAITRTGSTTAHLGLTGSSNCAGCHGPNATDGTHITHVNGIVETVGISCTSCHAQPPSGISSPDTQGAHTLHAGKGYGSVPDSGCDYCHSTGGSNDNNGVSHPNTVTNVSTNLSATIGTYTPISGSGKNDKCASVSCHANGAVSVAANIGNATWDGTLLSCANCHSTLTTGLPPTGNHSKHYTTKGYQCATCHGTNADSGTQPGHKNNGLIDVSFTGLAAPGTFNSVTKTCNPYCHSPNNNDPKPDPTWGTTLGACGTSCHTKPPAITRTGSTIHAGLSGSSDCEGCHGTGANGGTQIGHVNGNVDGSGASCTGCHSNVGASLGLHSNLSGTSSVEDSDCQTCHFGTFLMTTGAANSSNTRYCEYCHTSGGSGTVKPTNPALIKDGLSHGNTDCKWCHAAGDQPAFKYHTGPKGTAAGTNCLTCHLNSNLESPFYAPGEVHATSSISSCSTCHYSNNHAVMGIKKNVNPVLQDLITSPVPSGDLAEVQATLKDPRSPPWVMMAKAQYRIKDASGIVVIDWIDMIPKDGRFNSFTEIVNASINTDGLGGTYTVEMKGMSSAPKTDLSLPYYPDNGLWSSIATIPLIVTQPMGYVNGSVKDGSNNAIAGATITTNSGISTISNSSGFYSLNLVYGSYQLTASKDPEYYPTSSVSVTINTIPATQNFNLNQKPKGTISGTVRIK